MSHNFGPMLSCSACTNRTTHVCDLCRRLTCIFHIVHAPNGTHVSRTVAALARLPQPPALQRL
jgi:hypothetical protein